MLDLIKIKTDPSQCRIINLHSTFLFTAQIIAVGLGMYSDKGSSHPLKCDLPNPTKVTDENECVGYSLFVKWIDDDGKEFIYDYR